MHARTHARTSERHLNDEQQGQRGLARDEPGGDVARRRRRRARAAAAESGRRRVDGIQREQHGRGDAARGRELQGPAQRRGAGVVRQRRRRRRSRRQHVQGGHLRLLAAGRELRAGGAFEEIIGSPAEAGSASAAVAAVVSPAASAAAAAVADASAAAAAVAADASTTTTAAEAAAAAGTAASAAAASAVRPCGSLGVRPPWQPCSRPLPVAFPA